MTDGTPCAAQGEAGGGISDLPATHVADEEDGRSEFWRAIDAPRLPREMHATGDREDER